MSPFGCCARSDATIPFSLLLCGDDELLGRLDLGIYNLPSHIPANFPVATGMAFASDSAGEMLQP